MSLFTNVTNPNTVTSDGQTVTAAIWTTNFNTIYNFVNNTIIAALNTLTTKGDLYVTDGNNLNRLGVGANGQVLSADSTQTNGLKWVAPPGIPLTTNGDTLYYNAAANQRLPIGTNGQVLTVVAGLPAWAAAPGVPSGIIAIWSGSIGTIPSGWVLCDGNNGTSNLQGLFIVGAGSTSPAAVGGMGLLNPGGPSGDSSAGVGLGPSHNHTIIGNVPQGSVGNAAISNIATATVTPRYYALCYIQKT